MEIEDRVARRYALTNEEDRLWTSGVGDLVRLRTWDVLDRLLPSSGRIIDVGGGPGAHAAYLADKGYDVILLDPVEKHVDLARNRATERGHRTFEALVGEARELPFDDESCDAVLLMGPLYHLVDSQDRELALREAHRVLRPGGTIVAEVISRFAWLLDGAVKDRLDRPEAFETFQVNIDSGFSKDPKKFIDGEFWGYLHRPEEIREELLSSAFRDVELVATEGFAWLLGDLDERMKSPESLLRALRITETEPSMIGCSAHIIALGVK